MQETKYLYVDSLLNFLQHSEYRQKIENDFENIKQIFEEAELANPVDRYHVNSAPRNAVYALIDKSTIDTANGFRDLCVQIDQIGKDKSACSENVKKFNQIAIMRFLTSVFYFGSGEVNKDHHKHAVVGAGMTFGVIFNDNVQDLIKSFASSSAVATRIGRLYALAEIENCKKIQTKLEKQENGNKTDASAVDGCHTLVAVSALLTSHSRQFSLYCEYWLVKWCGQSRMSRTKQTELPCFAKHNVYCNSEVAQFTVIVYLIGRLLQKCAFDIVDLPFELYKNVFHSEYSVYPSCQHRYSANLIGDSSIHNNALSPAQQIVAFSMFPVHWHFLELLGYIGYYVEFKNKVFKKLVKNSQKSPILAIRIMQTNFVNKLCTDELLDPCKTTKTWSTAVKDFYCFAYLMMEKAVAAFQNGIFEAILSNDEKILKIEQTKAAFNDIFANFDYRVIKLFDSTYDYKKPFPPWYKMPSCLNCKNTYRFNQQVPLLAKRFYLNHYSHLDWENLLTNLKSKLFYGAPPNELKKQWNIVFDYKNLKVISMKATAEKRNVPEAIDSAANELATVTKILHFASFADDNMVKTSQRSLLANLSPTILSTPSSLLPSRLWSSSSPSSSSSSSSSKEESSEYSSEEIFNQNVINCSSYEHTETSPPLPKPKVTKNSLFCVYVVLKRLTASANASAVGSRLKKGNGCCETSNERKTDKLESEERTGQNGSEETEFELLKKYNEIAQTISQAHVYTGQGHFGRPFEHLLNSLDTASAVSNRLHCTSGNSILTYLLARGVGSYHQLNGPVLPQSKLATQGLDKPIAFFKVFETKSQIVAQYVAWCIKQYATKQATVDHTTVKDQTAIMQLFSKMPCLVPLLFDRDVIYLIACHMNKRVILASERLHWLSLSEYISSRHLICLHNQSPLPNMLKTVQHFQHDTVQQNTVQRDASHTAIPLDEANKIKFTILGSSVKQQLRQYLITEVFNNSIFLDFASHLRTASSPHIVAQPTSKNFKIDLFIQNLDSLLPSWSGPEIFTTLANLIEKFYTAVYEDVLEFANTPEVRQNQQSSLAKKEAQPTFNSISNISDNCTVLPPYQSSIELSASALRALFDIVVCDQMRYWILTFRISLDLTSNTTCTTCTTSNTTCNCN